jgi:hypothetical protein
MQETYDHMKSALNGLRQLARIIRANKYDGGREVALAITNQQQSMMWVLEYAKEVGDLIIE